MLEIDKSKIVKFDIIKKLYIIFQTIFSFNKVCVILICNLIYNSAIRGEKMDELSIVIAIATMGIFMFIGLCVYAYHNRGRLDLKIVLISSGLYAFASALFYFDVRNLLKGSTSILITFSTSFSVLLSLSLFVRSLRNLYQVKSRKKIVTSILFSSIMASLITFSSYHKTLFFRSVFYYLGITLILIYALMYQYKSKLQSMCSLISIQIYLILSIILVNLILFLGYDNKLYISNAPEFFTICLMMINILIATLIFSYIIERNAQDISELREKSDLLENMFNRVKIISETDELTQVYNRRKIKDILKIMIMNFHKYEVPFSILLIDIDNFKSINDNYTHQTGDKVLTHTTKLLRDLTRETDFIGRWGGDEFIIILSNTTEKNSFHVKEKIQNAKKAYISDEHSIPIKLSIGCSQIAEGSTINELIHQADIGLFKDKDKKSIRLNSEY